MLLENIFEKAGVLHYFEVLPMHFIQFFKENNLALFWLSFAEVLVLL